MDRMKEALEEIDQKAVNSSNVYELIMDLIKESPSKIHVSSGNDRFLTSRVIGKPENCGQL
jgi:hypothetical protein